MTPSLTLALLLFGQPHAWAIEFDVSENDPIGYRIYQDEDESGAFSMHIHGIYETNGAPQLGAPSKESLKYVSLPEPSVDLMLVVGILFIMIKGKR